MTYSVQFSCRIVLFVQSTVYSVRRLRRPLSTSLSVYASLYCLQDDKNDIATSDVERNSKKARERGMSITITLSRYHAHKPTVLPSLDHLLASVT